MGYQNTNNLIIDNDKLDVMSVNVSIWKCIFWTADNYADQQAEVDEETLQRYIDLEKEIQGKEVSSPLKNLELKSYELSQIEQQIPKLETELKEIQDKT
jgi:hypothetical protein